MYASMLQHVLYSFHIEETWGSTFVTCLTEPGAYDLRQWLAARAIRGQGYEKAARHLETLYSFPVPEDPGLRWDDAVALRLNSDATAAMRHCFSEILDEWSSLMQRPGTSENDYQRVAHDVFADRTRLIENTFREHHQGNHVKRLALTTSTHPGRILDAFRSEFADHHKREAANAELAHIDLVRSIQIGRAHV